MTLPALRNGSAAPAVGPPRLRDEARQSAGPAAGRSPGEMADLTVSGVRVRYGQQVALHGVDIEVPAGSCAAVLGANGAGKTSLLGAISGLNRPIEGEIWFGPVRIDSRAAHSIGGL